MPTGNTEFQIETAGFSFHSTGYDWLVIGGAKAQYRGSGTINGLGDYEFLLTAIDGGLGGGGGSDRLRVKIWNQSTGAILYDNQLDVSDDADPITVWAAATSLSTSHDRPLRRKTAYRSP